MKIVFFLMRVGWHHLIWNCDESQLVGNGAFNPYFSNKHSPFISSTPFMLWKQEKTLLPVMMAAEKMCRNSCWRIDLTILVLVRVTPLLNIVIFIGPCCRPEIRTIQNMFKYIFNLNNNNNRSGKHSAESPITLAKVRVCIHLTEIHSAYKTWPNFLATVFIFD